MNRSIEVVYDGRLSQAVIDYLTSDLGLQIQQTRPLVVHTSSPRLDVPAVVGAAKLISGVRHIWVRGNDQAAAAASTSAAGEA